MHACETAGGNRSTFYLHYDYANDLLQETVEAVYKDFFGRFDVEGTKGIDIDDKDYEELYLVTPRCLMPYLDFVEENRKHAKGADVKRGLAVPGSTAFVLSVADLIIAGEIINDLAGRKND